MSDRRRAEIELKRAKLAELRKAREDRKKQDEIRKSNNSTPGMLSSGTDDRRDDERNRVNNLVTNLLGDRNLYRLDSTPGSSVPSTPGPGHSTLVPSSLGHNQNGTRSQSRMSESGSERGAHRNNTMVQAGDAPDR
jgi:dynein intermediate chain, cytosolic